LSADNRDPAKRAALIPPADSALAAELRATLEDLAAFGEKRAGTPAGARAAEYLRQRLAAAGLAEVRAEPFAFPSHEVIAASVAVEVGGIAREIHFSPLEATGAGTFAADLVYAGWATDEQLAATPVRGQVALVERNPLFHRSTQYANLVAAGARAMVTLSTAPHNLRQVGSVRRSWEAMGPIPALSVGGEDGRFLRGAARAGRPVQLRVDIAAEVTRGHGRNVLGVVPGLEPATIVVGAHFDSWFAGSTDNGGGVAAMLALAARRARRPPGRYTLVFVAWDGEELALYGGYHFLRLHALAERPLLVIDFETPSALQAQAYGLARSTQPPLLQAIERTGLGDLFALHINMDLVPELFGGVIPTDVQGLYRSGAASMATAVEAPWYHTVEDTPDKVDLPRLAETVYAFDRLLEALMAAGVSDGLRLRDPALWRLDAAARRDGEALWIEVRARDGGGRSCAEARIVVTLFHDDFFASGEVVAVADAEGQARVRFGGDLARGERRFVHVTAGQGFPRAEAVLAVVF
jgi:peptidase M28-like protein